MMKKATGRTGKNGKERRAGLWSISLIAGIQIVGLVFFPMGTPGIASAKTFLVNSTKDEVDENYQDGNCSSTPSGVCTLRAAIQEANWLDGPDTIRVPAGLYMLTIPGKDDFSASGDLDIISDGFGNNDLTITGMGANKTFINGGKLDRVFHILSPVSVTIAKVTIQNGVAADGGLSQALGGGILMTPESTLTVKKCTISNNAASHTVDAYGGGIYSEGTLRIIDSTFWNNSASSGRWSWGGGIHSRQAVLTITGSSFSNNSASGSDTGLGGGISSFQNVSTMITNSSLFNNSASGGQLGDRAGYGGGIHNFDGPLTITNSSLSNNSVSGVYAGAGGGIFNGTLMTPRTFTITNSSLSNNSASGGGVAAGGGINSDGTVTIRSSTLSQNAVSGRSDTGSGGGIYVSGGTLTVQNGSKIIRNFASDEGGGIWHGGLGGNISADSTLSKNIPDNIYPLP
jgi:large repetitive protein